MLHPAKLALTLALNPRSMSYLKLQHQNLRRGVYPLLGLLNAKLPTILFHLHGRI
jgi:hypothetical protein